MHTDERERAAALAALRTFGERILPGTLRRIASWKRLSRGELPELLDDLLQELAIDCLEHARTIVALPPAARHGRWMRMAERWVYRFHVRPRIPAAKPAGQPSRWDAGDAATRDLPEVSDRWVRLGNGRWNLSASAARAGRPLAALQAEVEQLAVRLGCDGERDAFWRARLAEALTGLAADLLRERGGLLLLPGRRCSPDPERRLRRVRALARHFHLRASTIDARRAVRRWVARARLDDAAPQRLLHDAVQIWPHSTVAWSWLGEACVARGDLAGALAAVRAHRHLRPEQHSRTTLLRARVLEMRGRFGAAVRLLQRARRRSPHDARLRRALAAIRA